MKKMLKKENVGIDDPLESPSEDCLDRDNFAKRVFTVIENTPIETHIRVGIYGDWGSGKTSVLNFIKYYCVKNGHPVSMFHPWQFHNREDAWKGLVASIDKGLSTWRKPLLGNFKRKRFIKDVSGKARKLAEIADTKIGKAIGELILSPLEGLLEETKANIKRDLKKILKNKRLYVFIDDLDRAEPEIVYDMLMLLNEIFDLNQCIYIIGLDTKTVGEVLRKKLGYVNSKEFLNKIINWPFELPIPSKFDWDNLLDNESKNLGVKINEGAIKAISEILPKNPRKFKHFLRYLSSLHKGFLSRFGKDELNWRMLYLAQLLRIEFPEVFRVFMQDKEIIDDIATGILYDKQKDLIRSAVGVDKKDEPLEWKFKIEGKLMQFEDINKDRFFEIYDSLRNYGGFITPEYVRNHLLVIEVPELMTWNEYYIFKNKLLNMNNRNIITELLKYINERQEKKEIECVREFIRTLMREYEQVWNQLLELHTQDEIRQKIDEIDKIMRVCNLLTDIDKIFKNSNSIFNDAVFEEWYEHLSKWANFKEPKDLYEPIRKEERRLLLKIVEKNKHRASTILEILHPKFMKSGISNAAMAFADTEKEIKTTLQKALSEDLLNRFEGIDGIKDLLPGVSFAAEKELLFYDNTVFHNKEIYEKLQIIADKAKDNVEIQKNFVEFLRMLFYAATDFMQFTNKEEVLKLIKKSEFFSIVWNAALCRPLNRRLVGSLEECKNKLYQILKDGKLFKVPQWWEDLITDKTFSAQ